MIGPGALDGLDFEAVECAARRFALLATGHMLAARFNADQSDHETPHLPCTCGQEEAHFAGRRKKTFTSLLGPLHLERAWYHCDGCGHGFAPRDKAFGLDGSTLTPGALRAVGIAAGRVSFAESSELLRELACLGIDPKTVERHAEALGREIAEDERLVVEPEPTTARTVYLGLDGTGIPVRKSETEGRKGKQPDGSARTREVKLATIWTAESTDKDGMPVRDKGSPNFNAAVETIATRDTDTEDPPFAQRVQRECTRSGFDDAEIQAILADAAAWIWRFAEENFPRAIQIIDVFHARQHLFDAARAIFGGDNDLATQWANQRCDELDEGRIDKILHELRKHAARCKKADSEIGYFTNNRNRMRYPEFRAMGLCVSTGIVEGACKSVIGKRLKQGGMHWTVDGANAIIALRCALESNRFENFWERRACRNQ